MTLNSQLLENSQFHFENNYAMKMALIGRKKISFVLILTIFILRIEFVYSIRIKNVYDENDDNPTFCTKRNSSNQWFFLMNSKMDTCNNNNMLLLKLFENDIVILIHNFMFFLQQGQFFSGSGYRIYLLGNPIIWWSNLLFLAIFLVVFAIAAIRKQRGYANDMDNNGKTNVSYHFSYLVYSSVSNHMSVGVVTHICNIVHAHSIAMFAWNWKNSWQPI